MYEPETETITDPDGVVDIAQTVPFAAIFQQINRGRDHGEASEALRSLVEAVTGTGRPGTVTVQIRVEKGKSEHLDVSATVTTKQPRPKPTPSIFWSDPDGNLTRTNPDQPSLPFGIR
jgi:hypothetical protein